MTQIAYTDGDVYDWEQVREQERLPLLSIVVGLPIITSVSVARLEIWNDVAKGLGGALAGAVGRASC